MVADKFGLADSQRSLTLLRVLKAVALAAIYDAIFAIGVFAALVPALANLVAVRWVGPVATERPGIPFLTVTIINHTVVAHSQNSRFREQCDATKPPTSR